MQASTDRTLNDPGALGVQRRDSTGAQMTTGTKVCIGNCDGAATNNLEGSDYTSVGPITINNDGPTGHALNMVSKVHDATLGWTYTNGNYEGNGFLYNEAVNVYSAIMMPPSALYTGFAFSSLNYQPLIYMYK